MAWQSPVERNQVTILGKERLFAVLASYDGFLDAWKEAEAVLQDGSEPGKT